MNRYSKYELILARHSTLTISVAWGIVSIVLYGMYGFNYTLEAEKYILQADYVLTHYSFEEARFLYYATTIVLICISKLLTGHVALAVLLLLVINWYAYLKLYKALLFYYNNAFTALGVVLALLLFVPYQSWTMYLYTESIFYSIIILLIAKLIRITTLSNVHILVLATYTILLILSRPLGILFIPGIGIYMLLKANAKQRIALGVLGVASIVGFYAVSQVIFTSTPDWQVQRSFLEENLICDVPTVASQAKLNLIQSSSQLEVLLYYITHNFAHFIGLAGRRLLLFGGLTRSYYSTLHNVALLVYILPLYIIIIIGVRHWWHKLPMPLVICFLVTIVLFAASVAVQCDDYHNRFYLSILPMLVILAGTVLHYTISKYYAGTIK